MYFNNFSSFLYPFKIKDKTEYKLVTDITQNVRIRKQVLANVTLYDEYDIREGETPEIIAEKIYGSPEYHWVVMLCNERYDYINDFPLSQYELDQHVTNAYGSGNEYLPHHYIDVNGNRTDTGLKSLTLTNPGYGYIQTPAITIVKSTDDIENVSEFVPASATVTISDQIPFTGSVTGNVLTITYVTQPVRIGQLVYDQNTTSGSTVSNYNVGIPAGTKIVSQLTSTAVGGGSGSIGTYQLNNSVASTVQTLIGIPGLTTTPTVTLYATDGLVLGVNLTSTGKGYYHIPTVTIDAPSYGTQATSTVDICVYETITNTDYETQINESKRRIKLISPNLLNTILKNFTDLI
jgi:hypothetical protein